MTGHIRLNPAGDLRHTQSFSRICSIPVDPANGFKRVVIELSAPAMPSESGSIGFAEHVLDDNRQPTDTVIACTRGGVVVSEDLGESWDYVPILELRDIDLRNSFTTSDGLHLLQGRSAAKLGVSRTGEDFNVPIGVLDQNWKFQNRVCPGASIWHGSRSIDEADGVIVYGEYPANSRRPRPGSDSRDFTPEQLGLLHDSQLFRSIDGGRSWDSVLRVDWQTIRHFHTVVADPWLPGRWWASSGDGPDECRVWQSLDHGLTWSEIPSEPPAADLHPAYPKMASSNVLRFTDLIVRESDLIWGADDYLGAGWLKDSGVPAHRRAGSRLFRSSKDLPWRPESIGYVGNPIRSLIDVGPAYLVTTEAKGRLGYSPQVLLLSKSEPFQLTPLMIVDNFRSAAPGTGFTYSRASRAVKDGVFFSYRTKTDLFPDGAGLLRWRVAFD